MSEVINDLSKGQKTASNIFAALVVIVGGVILLLSGLGILTVETGKLILPIIFGMIGAMLLFNAIVQHNTVALYLGCMFAVFMTISLLAHFVDDITYGMLWPLYFASIPVASFITMLFSHNFLLHIKVILIVGVPSALLMLQSCGVLGFEIALPLLIIFVGLVMLYFIISVKRGIKEE